jgi:hypothetical protein
MDRKSYKEQFNEEGYIYLPKLLSGQQLQTLLGACERVLAKYTEEWDRRKPGQDFHSIRNIHSPKMVQSEQDKKIILETAADPRFVGAVEQIFEGPSLFRATTYWMNPRYSSMEGNWHRDSQNTMSEEDEKVYLRNLKEADLIRGVQLQIALVDNDDLEYVPFSANRYDAPEEYYYRLADQRSHSRDPEGMPNAKRFHMKAGDAVAFNQIGLHRGRYHADNQRRTLMLTYTPENNPIYDNTISIQPWFLEEGYMDGLSPRAGTYFNEYIRAYRDHWGKQLL